jgi:HisJ family histidinol phosphate phosphatase
VVSEGLRRGMRYSIGAEVDNDPRSRPDAQNIVDAMRPDAIIRSVHFIPITHPVHGENWPWPFDNPEFGEFYDVVGTEVVWETYVNALVDAIERLPGHIVGHFFVPAVFGHWPDDAKLEVYEDRVLAAAGARQMAVEFNTRFLYRDHDDEAKRRYLDANRRFLRKAKERGVGIAIGSDAHSPKDQGGAFDVVLDLLDELEINEIIFPLGGSLRRVALRVVREPEPEPVPEPPAPPPEPVTVPSRDAAAAEPAAAKPVRKARTTSKPVRTTGSSAERPPERAEPPAATPPPPVGAEEDAEPVEPKPVVRKAAPIAAPKPAPKAPAAPQPPKPDGPPVKAATKPAPKPAAKSGPKPPVKAPVKAQTAHGQAKAVVAKKPATAAAKARPKPAPAKAVAKKAAPSASKRAAPAKKAAPKKPAPKKPAPKKVTSARSPAKKAAPAKKKLAKKAAAKKAAPARKAPARKTSAAKKTTAKKTAPKRR